MVIQETVNLPPLARLVRSQDAPPFFKGEYHEKENYSPTTKLSCQIGIVS